MNTNIYIPKTSHIKNVIHSIWQVDRSDSQLTEQIIPKGVVEIIFNFSSRSIIPVQLGSKQFDIPCCMINGFNTAPIQMPLPRRQYFFGVRFQPLAIKKLLGVPAGEFSDKVIDLTLVDASFKSLWHELSEQHDFNTRVGVFCNWLEQKIPEWLPQEQLINNFLCTDHQHDLSVSSLASSMCYSSRHLSRKLFEATGLNAEDMLLYKKYLRAVHLIHHSSLSLTEIAYESSFSDQSHFIRSFKAFAAMTPGKYSRSKSYVPGHIYEDVR